MNYTVIKNLRDKLNMSLMALKVIIRKEYHAEVSETLLNALELKRTLKITNYRKRKAIEAWINDNSHILQRRKHASNI